jgi:hypothetical protein
LTDLPVFSLPEYGKMGFGMLSVRFYMSVYLWTLLAPEQLNGIDSYLGFNNLFNVG